MKRLPGKPRDSFPTHWVTFYGWRRALAFTPKVGSWSLMVIVDLLPRSPRLVGLFAGRNEDEALFARVGVGLVEVDIEVMEWCSHKGSSAVAA